MKKRLVAFIMTLAMVLTIVPIVALAEDLPEVSLVGNSEKSILEGCSLENVRFLVPNGQGEKQEVPERMPFEYNGMLYCIVGENGEDNSISYYLCYANNFDKVSTDAVATVTINYVENPIEKVELVTDYAYAFVNVGCNMDTDWETGNTYNRYQYDCTNVKLYFKNDYVSEFGETQEVNNTFDIYGETYSVGFADDQSYSNQWGVGKHNVEVFFAGLMAETPFVFEIFDTPIITVENLAKLYINTPVEMVHWDNGYESGESLETPYMPIAPDTKVIISAAPGSDFPGETFVGNEISGENGLNYNLSYDGTDLFVKFFYNQIGSNLIKIEKTDVCPIKNIITVSEPTHQYYRFDPVFSKMVNTVSPTFNDGLKFKIEYQDGSVSEVYDWYELVRDYVVYFPPESPDYEWGIKRFDELYNNGFSCFDEWIIDNYKMSLETELLDDGRLQVYYNYYEKFPAFVLDLMDSDVVNMETSSIPSKEDLDFYEETLWDGSKIKECTNVDQIEITIETEDGTKKTVNLGDYPTTSVDLAEAFQFGDGPAISSTLYIADEDVSYQAFYIDGYHALITWDNYMFYYKGAVMPLYPDDMDVTVSGDAKAKVESSELDNKGIIDAVLSGLSDEEKFELQKTAEDLSADISIKDSTSKKLDVFTTVAGKDGYDIGGFCFDVDITAKLGENSPTQITEISDNTKLQFRLPIPEEYQGLDSYVVYREHTNSDGSVVYDAITDVTVSEDGKFITFYSTKFSSFALGFKPEDETPGGNSGTNNETPTLPETVEKIANTLDNTPIAATMMLVCSSGLCLFAVARKRKEIE
ncbi:MAG: hypothetical protein KBS82_06260 [Oscillospiraceae bacterium]|nr:hypothetical protein [Candidatus Limimonas egerieequi]